MQMFDSERLAGCRVRPAVWMRRSDLLHAGNKFWVKGRESTAAVVVASNDVATRRFAGSKQYSVRLFNLPQGTVVDIRTRHIDDCHVLSVAPAAPTATASKRAQQQLPEAQAAEQSARMQRRRSGESSGTRTAADRDEALSSSEESEESEARAEAYGPRNGMLAASIRGRAMKPWQRGRVRPGPNRYSCTW